ncbi:squalene/phytoene synthase family protein [Afifella sp. IM 167]|uniref:phytoene/squalene synthase family protein n=1 Tax=Afifella sp. IM 167 TaxID=2033586 RepID=UPI001CCF5305|nr:squalene/phytoene synthase family protein [Afifella sp. IM 167]MBZ8132547.1 phytoene/squalene synthase family protein [Afifella sp. IM 167]
MAEPDPNLSAPVKERDLPRYYSVLFAPAHKREDLLALYAFAVEAERVADIVKEPALGEIRLTWWRDALATGISGAASGAPIIDRLASALKACDLDERALAALTEARQADLYADPPADRTELEGRLGETQSSLFQLAGLMLGGEAKALAEAAGHAGIAYGLATGLWRLSADRARGRLLIPLDMLEGAGLSAEAAYRAEPARLAGPIEQLAALAEAHRQKAVSALSDVGREARPAFLPLAAARLLISRERQNPAAFAKAVPRAPALAILSRIAIAALKG